MMMFDLDPQVASLFYQKNYPTGKEMTKASGIHTLCPGAQIDDRAFTPCGYSMNAILHDAYFTVHITPQEECSYASFETNTCFDRCDALSFCLSLRSGLFRPLLSLACRYSPLVRNVLTVFRPRRFVLTMFGDQLAIDGLASLPTDTKRIPLHGRGHYQRSSFSSTQVETDLCCLMACYTFEPCSKSIVSEDLVKPLLSIEAKAGSARRERGYSLC